MSYKSDLLNAVFSTEKPDTITAYDKYHTGIKYPARMLNVLKSDDHFIMIVDDQTGEILMDHDDWIISDSNSFGDSVL